MDNYLRFQMLGRFSVRQGNREISRFRTQKTAALLAYLAFYKQRSHPRDVLIELFWPESPLQAARSNLSVALNALRGQLEGPDIPRGAILTADRSMVRLNPAAYTTDAEEFALLLQNAEALPEAGERTALQIQALALYQGDLLPGFYEDWIFAERDRLRNRYLSTLKQVVKSYVETRQYEPAIEYAHRLVQADPRRESAYHILMRMYAATGRSQDALNQYAALERVLREEAGSVPSAPLRELAATLRENVPAPRLPAVPQSSKDRPSTSTADLPPQSFSPPRRVTTIPLQFARFFGREPEMARLAELVSLPSAAYTDSENENSQSPGPRPGVREVSRLITLTGPGGTGKTRLAIEVARRVEDAFAGHVWFVPLADLYDPLRLGGALRNVMGLPRQIQSSALDDVIAFLNGLDAAALLILDNFEQISAGGALIVWTLLHRAGLVRCLVTSRLPLQLPGEHEVVIAPLPVPDMELSPSRSNLLASDVLAYPSAALFVDRAQAARPEFQITARNAQAIAGICSKLEGIPLAIELAATRARALTPSQILDRLDERFKLLAARHTGRSERHRSLWAAMDWSYRLLPPELQRFFTRLSVFRGGWRLETAEEVCAEPRALDYLAQLRGHSLILAGESGTDMRFRMLETIRVFAAEQLTPDERQALEERHATYFARWVTGAQTSGPEQLVWFERFEEDLDNLRALLEWSLAEEHTIELGLQTAGDLLVFWRVRGHLVEGRAWNNRLLERAGETPTIALSKALHCAGSLASLTGDLDTAGELLKRCRDVVLALGDDKELAVIQNELGAIAYRRGEYTQARAHYEECLALGRANGTPGRAASALTNLACIAQATGDFSAARALYSESLEMWRESGEQVGEARTLYNLAVLALSERKLDDARALFEQSLAIRRGLADHYGISCALAGIAETANDRGDYVAAVANARESLALAQTHELPVVMADAMHILIDVCRALGELEAAARLYGALEQVRETIRYTMTPVNRNEYDKIQTALHESLGTERYKAARKDGRSLSLQQALALLEETLRNRAL